MDALIVTLIIGALIGIRVGFHFLDKREIRSAAEAKGWSKIEISWEPFAQGWFFEKNERQYRVLYVDQKGRHQLVFCKTSLTGGVYWRDEGSK